MKRRGAGSTPLPSRDAGEQVQLPIQLRKTPGKPSWHFHIRGCIYINVTPTKKDEDWRVLMYAQECDEDGDRQWGSILEWASYPDSQTTVAAAEMIAMAWLCQDSNGPSDKRREEMRRAAQQAWERRTGNVVPFQIKASTRKSA